MTKYEALKQLPMERFGDTLCEMFIRSKDAGDFNRQLLEPFPDELIPALQKCSTGEDLLNFGAGCEDSSNNHRYKCP